MNGHRLRIATYNVHKCQGLDGRTSPERIVRVLREVEADVIALQEVLSDHGAYLRDALGMEAASGENRRHKGVGYGNLVLSRLPLRHSYNHDISVPGREARGILRADVAFSDGRLLHIFNAHLGTGFIERRRQARRLAEDRCIDGDCLRGPRIVLGDFNEWTRGLASKVLSELLPGPELRPRLRRSYPGLLPVLHLDHIYYDPSLTAEHIFLHRSRASLIASDHLPLVADFRMD